MDNSDIIAISGVVCFALIWFIIWAKMVLSLTRNVNDEIPTLLINVFNVFRWIVNAFSLFGVYTTIKLLLSLYYGY